MIRKIFTIFVPLLILASFLVSKEASALPMLDPTYDLYDFSSQPIVGTSTAFVTVSGQVSAVGGGDPSSVHLFFKYQKSDFSNPVATSTFFTAQSNGNFTDTIGTNAETPFDCQADYTIWLYEGNQNILQAVFQGGTAAPGFQVTIDCSPAAQVGDLYAPDSVGTTVLHGVNWGTVTTTSNSININGAHLIPFVQNGPKSFKIEYGRAQNNQVEEPIGFSAPFTRYPPTYNFNLSINVPLPNTQYYFDMYEVTGGTPTGLLTYGYATTAKIDGPANVHFNFPDDTSLRISGNLPGSNALMGFPIDIVILNQNGSPLMTAQTTTSAPGNFANGQAYFENLFTTITGSGLVPGGTYSVVIRGTVTQTDLTTPVTFIVPSPDNPNPNPPNPNNPTTPAYSGLIACGNDPSHYDCNFDTLIATINRFVNFIIIFVAFPVVAIVIAWAGVLLITSGGSSSKKEHAKSMITHVVAGLVVALLAWAIIKLILVVFGYVPTGPLWSVLNTTPN